MPYVEENVVGHNFEGWLQNSILTVLSMTNFFKRASDGIHVKMQQNEKAML